MTPTTDDAVLAALRRLLPDRDAKALAGARHTPLEGGINRRSFLVVLGAERWVLRLPTPGTAGLIDVATEATAMRAAAAAGLAPTVVAVDSANGTLLTTYRAGAVAWTAADARRLRNLERAARLLRALHGIDARIPAYAAEEISRGYLTALSSGVSPEPTRPGGVRIAAWSDELLELARAFDARHPPVALCHNDLAAANFIDDGPGGDAGRTGGALLLVDFEYAVRSSPLLDLAGLAGMNDFSAAQRRDLLDVYGEGAPTATELDRAVRMVRLMSFFWARLGAQRAADAAPYLRLAVELGERLA
ncbi:MAG TPA: phosphotransferase [Gammaproteobacteria bacterium]|nr:phosphotransferase [Gammaproteobacteria bacterium]